LAVPYPNILQACAEANLDIAIWNIGTNGTQKGAYYASPEAVNFCIRNVTNSLPALGKGGIITTHAIADDAATLPYIIEAVRKQGLTPKSMSKIF